MLDADHGWGIAGAEGEDQHVVRTEDGGRTWLDVSPPVLTYALQDCGIQSHGQFESASSAWIGYTEVVDASDGGCVLGGVSDLWATEDGGRSWRMSSFVQRNSDTFGAIGAGFPILEFVDSLHGWTWRGFFLGAGSSAYELHRTEDGGRTWQLMPDGYVFRVTGLDFLDRNHGWATTSYPLGYSPPLSLNQTHDGGITWERSEVPLPDDPANLSSCSVHSPVLRSAAAGEVTVGCAARDLEPAWYRYQTADGGHSWRIQSIPVQPEQRVSGLVGWIHSRPPGEPQSDPANPQCTLSWTHDGGRTWSEVGSLACSTELDFVSDAIGWGLQALDEDRARLLQTSDGGRTWQPLEAVSGASPLAGERSAPPRLLPTADRRPIDAQSLYELHVLQELPAEAVTALASYPERDLLLAGHSDGAATFWQPAAGGYGRLARLHQDWIYNAAVARHASLLATASRDGHLRFWFLFGNSLWEDLAGLGGEVSSVAFAPQAALFASAGQDQIVRLWALDPAGIGSIEPPTAMPAELRGHQAWVWDVALSPDGTLLASGSADRSIRIWEVETGELLEILTAHEAAVGALAFSPDGSRLVSGAWDGSLAVWDTETWEPVRVTFEPGARIHSLSFMVDGLLFATGTSDGTLKLWSAESGQSWAAFSVSAEAVRVVLFTPDAQLLLTASDDGMLRLWGVGP